MISEEKPGKADFRSYACILAECADSLAGEEADWDVVKRGITFFEFSSYG